MYCSITLRHSVEVWHVMDRPHCCIVRVYAFVSETIVGTPTRQKNRSLFSGLPASNGSSSGLRITAMPQTAQTPDHLSSSHPYTNPLLNIFPAPPSAPLST